jgi:hypothetical protein
VSQSEKVDIDFGRDPWHWETAERPKALDFPENSAYGIYGVLKGEV